MLDDFKVWDKFKESEVYDDFIFKIFFELDRVLVDYI